MSYIVSSSQFNIDIVEKQIKYLYPFKILVFD